MTTPVSFRSLVLMALAFLPAALTGQVEVTSTGVVVNGTYGSIYTTADQGGFTATGVLLKSAASKPYIVANLGTTADANSSFSVYDSASLPRFVIRADGYVKVGSMAEFLTSGELRIQPPVGASASLVVRSLYESGVNHPGYAAIRGAVVGGNYATYLSFLNDYTANTSGYHLGMASGTLDFTRSGDSYPAFSAGGNGTPLTFRGTTNSYVGSVTTDSSATYYNTSSDARLKTNIRDLGDSGAIVDALKPRVFDWKTGEKDTYGFVAQEVYPVFPQAVSRGDDDPEEIAYQWSMDASKLVPVLTAELKALRSRVAALEKSHSAPTTADLARQIADLSRRLEATENRSLVSP